MPRRWAAYMGWQGIAPLHVVVTRIGLDELIVQQIKLHHARRARRWPPRTGLALLKRAQRTDRAHAY
jgi:hypothetical protein